MMPRLLSPLATFGLIGLLASPVRLPAIPEEPELEAASWIVVDVATDTVLAGHNTNEERPMASVTKLMTSLVVRRHADLDARVRISESAAGVGEAEVGLVAGEVWSVRDLLAALLVRSGNDAAHALAEYVGGSVEGFADLMNEMAVELGLEHSHFVNPHGLDADGHYTSAHDLNVMAQAVLEDDVLAQLTRTGIIRFKPSPDGTDRIATNTNRLLNRYPGVVGMKTGYTGLAGLVLVSAYETDGQTFVVVVMGSEDHFGETAALLDYISQRLSLRDRFLLPLVEEGGGAAVSAIDADSQRFIKTHHDLPTGKDAVSSWGDTPGTQQLADMVRSMIPMMLGGTA